MSRGFGGYRYDWCPDLESNQGHKDFQSFALPTELSGLCKVVLLAREARIKAPDLPLVKELFRWWYVTFSLVHFFAIKELFSLL